MALAQPLLSSVSCQPDPSTLLAHHVQKPVMDTTVRVSLRDNYASKYNHKVRQWNIASLERQFQMADRKWSMLGDEFLFSKYLITMVFMLYVATIVVLVFFDPPTLPWKYVFFTLTSVFGVGLNAMTFLLALYLIVNFYNLLVYLINGGVGGLLSENFFLVPSNTLRYSNVHLSVSVDAPDLSLKFIQENYSILMTLAHRFDNVRIMKIMLLEPKYLAQTRALAPLLRCVVSLLAAAALNMWLTTRGEALYIIV
eukprot:GILK01008843.1.p1 GENE.GILK01008843.1~~GILK01008843.1.p1  ORF type:complete len:263 (-),score=19.89 GILK01008843.1:178-939(-)